MTTYVTYVAEDGTEFETEDECAAYERMQSVCGIRFFDQNLNEIPVNGSAVIAAEKSYFFVVENDEQANDFSRLIHEEYGERYWPEVVSDGQAWAYDADKEAWFELHEIVDGYRGLLTQLGCT